jgi:hypothetical protein
MNLEGEATSSAPALRPGEQLASTVCSTRVIVVRAPSGGRPLISCGGQPMVPAASAPPSPAAPADPAPADAAPADAAPADAAPADAAPADPATLIGKRYVDAAGTLEVLCTASGTGVLSCDGAPMTVKAAKPLPASD